MRGLAEHKRVVACVPGTLTVYLGPRESASRRSAPELRSSSRRRAPVGKTLPKARSLLFLLAGTAFLLSDAGVLYFPPLPVWLLVAAGTAVAFLLEWNYARRAS